VIVFVDVIVVGDVDGDGDVGRERKLSWAWT
jgi:hypothetical protein